MPEVETDFKCLRCGHEFVDLYDAKEPRERACAECGSNSVRPLKKTPKTIQIEVAEPAAKAATVAG